MILNKKTILLIFLLTCSLFSNTNQNLPIKGKIKSLSIFNFYKTFDVDTYKDKNIKPFIFMKATDEKLYFANAYFLSYTPFIPNNIFYVASYLSSHLKNKTNRYKLTHNFKTSKQAYKARLVSSEENALIMADWLITLGYDARVVVGTFKQNKHAWVLLNNLNNFYILDATNIGKRKRFPLAATLPNYHPKYMYNHINIWINKGSSFTTNYSSDNWVESYSFIFN